jgi:hypothetical protein
VLATALLLVTPALGKKPGSGPPGPMPGSGSSSATITAAPGTVVFGSPTTIGGQVSGKKAAGAKVELQSAVAPYTAPFSSVMSTTADGTGHYGFKVAPAADTKYRVVARTAPAAMSATLLVKVLVKVTLGVSNSRPKAGALVRFSGFVLPAYNGKAVQIQRRTRTGWKTVAQVKLAAASPAGLVARSGYTKRLRIRASGTYRVLFGPGDGLREANTSPTHTLRVR